MAGREKERGEIHYSTLKVAETVANEQQINVQGHIQDIKDHSILN